MTMPSCPSLRKRLLGKWRRSTEIQGRETGKTSVKRGDGRKIVLKRNVGKKKNGQSNV